MRRPALGLRSPGALAVVASVLVPTWGLSQETVSRIPLVPGLTLMSSLHFPEGDRENVIEVATVDSSGARYTWRLVEIRENGDTLVEQFGRRVRANDLAGAPRLDPVFKSSDPEERPGYTAFSLSSAVYTELRDRGTAAYSLTTIENAQGLLGAVASSVGGIALQERARYKGTLHRVSPKPAPFPLLIDGRRVSVPALQLKGTFARGSRRLEYEFWVLADSTHPLLLKTLVGTHVYQLVRVNFPVEVPESPAGALAAGDGDGAAAAMDEGGVGVGAAPGGARGGAGVGGAGTGPGGGGVATLERELDTVCRIELPGVYFAFNSAEIDPASDRSLAALARMLAEHRDWVMTLEGHTDSIGTAAANQKLSQRRAEAVRTRLAERHGVDTRPWNAVGYGPSRPREPNATIEGRARNRRVELVRDC
jgi:outer membrane protein OmpA-like peptidoglycan-associated protein